MGRWRRLGRIGLRWFEQAVTCLMLSLCRLEKYRCPNLQFTICLMLLKFLQNLLNGLRPARTQGSHTAISKQKAAPDIRFVLPNENWELVIEFEDGYRLFKASVAWEEFDWQELVYPQKLKNLLYTKRQIEWPRARVLSADYLYEKSIPVDLQSIQFEHLRVSYQNQAPTEKHPNHHVYCVYLYPFNEKPFSIGESIGGGHADTGYSVNYSLEELLALPEWERHFDLSGCAWAVPLLSKPSESTELLKHLVALVCQREGHIK